MTAKVPRTTEHHAGVRQELGLQRSHVNLESWESIEKALIDKYTNVDSPQFQSSISAVLGELDQLLKGPSGSSAGYLTLTAYRVVSQRRTTTKEAGRPTLVQRAAKVALGDVDQKCVTIKTEDGVPSVVNEPVVKRPRGRPRKDSLVAKPEQPMNTLSNYFTRVADAPVSPTHVDSPKRTS